MISQNGSIHFASEFVSLIDRFLTEYEKAEGPLENDLERGLIIAYLFNVMRCDLDLLGDCLGEQEVFKGLRPEKILDECIEKDQNKLAARRKEILDDLITRGWLPLESD